MVRCLQVQFRSRPFLWSVFLKRPAAHSIDCAYVGESVCMCQFCVESIVMRLYARESLLCRSVRQWTDSLTLYLPLSLSVSLRVLHHHDVTAKEAGTRTGKHLRVGKTLAAVMKLSDQVNKATREIALLVCWDFFLSPCVLFLAAAPTIASRWALAYMRSCASGVCLCSTWLERLWEYDSIKMERAFERADACSSI